DICVLHTAIDAYHLGYQLEIVKSAVASLTKESYEWSLAHFEQVLGAKLINDY
ncbi:cysteine hydrolase family protein, partial [Streptococcus pyogenes]